MAHFSKCTEQYAQKVFDSADIVRDAIFRQLTPVAIKVKKVRLRTFPLKSESGLNRTPASRRGRPLHMNGTSQTSGAYYVRGERFR